jgi:hypothetical protein
VAPPKDALGHKRRLATSKQCLLLYKADITRRRNRQQDMSANSAKQTLPISQSGSQQRRPVDLQLFTASTSSHRNDRGTVQLKTARWA